jgi:hypothetical protein
VKNEKMRGRKRTTSRRRSYMEGKEEEYRKERENERRIGEE